MPRKPKPPPQTLREVARDAMHAHAPTDTAAALEAVRRRVKADPKLLEEAIALGAGRAFELEVCRAYWAERGKAV